MQNKLFCVTYFCPALTSMMSAGPNLYSCPSTVTDEDPSYIDQAIHVHIRDTYQRFQCMGTYTVYGVIFAPCNFCPSPLANSFAPS